MATARGETGDSGNAIALDSAGNIYVAGTTYSTNFPTTTNAFQTTNNGINAFISKLGTASSVPVGTSTTLTADANPQSYDTKVTFTAYVQPASGTGVPAGTATFSIDGGAGTAETLDGTGHASYATSTLSAGKHTIAASYSGDTNYAASSTMLTELIIGPAASLSVVSGSGQSATVGTAFANPLVVVVQDGNRNAFPGAIVSFSGAGLSFSNTTATTGANGEASVTATPTAAGALTASATTGGVTGAATFSLTANLAVLPMVATPTFSPAAGTYSSVQTVAISTATSGATIYYTTDGSTPTTKSTLYSAAIAVSSTATINAIAVASGYANSAVATAAYTIDLPAPDFSVAISPSSVSITAGQSGTTAVSVTPQNGFGAAVSFACSGLPSGASCSFSPATVTPSGSAASTTLTVSAPAAVSSVRRDSRPAFPGAMLALAVCFFGWKKRRRMQVLLSLAVAAFSLTLFTGCGSGSGSSSSTPQTTASTITVTATSGALQHKASFSLTVQ